MLVYICDSNLHMSYKVCIEVAKCSFCLIQTGLYRKDSIFSFNYFFFVELVNKAQLIVENDDHDYDYIISIYAINYRR